MRGPFPVRHSLRVGPGRSVSCFAKEAYGVRRLSSGRKPCDGAQGLLLCQCLKLVDFSLPRNDRTGMFAAFRCFRILSGQVFMVWSFFPRSHAGLLGLYSHACKNGRNGVNSGTYGKKQRPVSLFFPLGAGLVVLLHRTTTGGLCVRARTCRITSKTAAAAVPAWSYLSEVFDLKRSFGLVGDPELP